jgi:Apoptosis regulator proteins, Bcl-2 family
MHQHLTDNVDTTDSSAAAHHPLASRIRNYLHDACGGSFSRRGDPSTPAAIAEATQSLAHFAVHCTIKNSDRSSCDRRPGQAMRPPRTQTEACLAASIRRMHEKHALLFRSMMDRLQIDRQVDFYLGFTELAVDLFGDDDVSWAKIVALYAFGARLGKDQEFFQ